MSFVRNRVDVCVPIDGRPLWARAGRSPVKRLSGHEVWRLIDDYNQRLAAHDRKRRRELVRRFAALAVISLVSGSIVATAVWESLSHTQDAFGPLQTIRSALAKVSQSANQQLAATDGFAGRQEMDRGRNSDWDVDALNRRLPEQFASSLHPADAHTEPQTQLAGEWEELQASDDLRAIWLFVVRNPDTPESALARLKLIGLIDTAEDRFLLHVLRLLATDAVAERAEQRLTALGVPAADAPASNPRLQDSASATIAVDREPPPAQRVPERPRAAAKQQATSRAPSKQVSSERRSTVPTPAISSFASLPLFGVGF